MVSAAYAQTEKMDRATPANLVMREFKRYARVRSKPNPRLKKMNQILLQVMRV